jgi:hypothetical protein
LQFGGKDLKKSEKEFLGREKTMEKLDSKRAQNVNNRYLQYGRSIRQNDTRQRVLTGVCPP